tara:strand:- start:1052 stop:1273 length:222 start_codon:yes stop_codon:yes gene_type:complete
MDKEILIVTRDIKRKYSDEATEKIHKLFDVLKMQKDKNDSAGIIQTQQKLIIALVQLNQLQTEIIDLTEEINN